MMSILAANRPLDHVGIAVHSIDDASGPFELLAQQSSSPVEVLEDQGVRVAFVGAVELLEPLGPETTIGRFLARRGPGLHHIAYRVDDLQSELDRLDAAGVRLIDRAPRPGAGGHRVAFVHPQSAAGVLVELVQR